MLSITLRQLEYAIAIGRHGGLTAAAEALHVSQPALSVALAQLEAHLGQPLFLRRPGGPMVPTGFGADWLAEAERQVAGLAALMSGPRTTPLRLAVFEDLAPALLAPLLAHATRHGLALTARPMGFAALGEALKAGTVDAAICWELGLTPGLMLRNIARIRPHAVLAADHPLAKRHSLALADLADQPLVLTDQDLSIAHVQVLFHRADLPCRIAHRSASLDLMRSFAANGLGVGLSYTQPAPRLSHDGKALVVLPIHDAGDEAVVLASLSDAAPPEGVAEMVLFLTSLLSPLQPEVTKSL
ncbi:MAG: LysR family transcriptional regulator [Cypionkella sp.]